MLRFHEIGEWGSGQVSAAWTKSTRRIDPHVETLIDLAWAEALSRPGVHLFDGPCAGWNRGSASAMNCN